MENYKKMLQNINTYLGSLGTTRDGIMSEKKQTVENVKSTLRKAIREGTELPNDERRQIRDKVAKLVKWYNNTEKRRPTAKGRGREYGELYQSRRNYSRILKNRLTRSKSPTYTSRNHPGVHSALAGIGGYPVVQSRTRKILTPPASGTWPLLKKSRRYWTVKVIPSSRGKATVSTLTGMEGGKLVSASHNVTRGKAGRSPLQEALREAEKKYEEKKEEHYTEVRSVHRSTNNELKSINNFVPN
jgi:ElaB/YqjD/DUF883 family membrane-anchored ribosome-binding protein